MNGAEAVTAALADTGIDTVFMNPGTTEIGLVQAIANNPSIRGILTLFEGVASGAADGFARVAGYPAATLLHLGPGLANATANFHNARRAASPVVSLVGEHARVHLPFDPPLASDIAALAGIHSKSTETVATSSQAYAATVRAFHAATSAPKGVATVVIPSDLADKPAQPDRSEPAKTSGLTPSSESLHRAAAALAARGAVIIAGGDALRRPAVSKLAALSSHGARIFAETFPAAHDRGGELPQISRLPYLPEQALALLQEASEVILIGARHPVSFFKYEGVPSLLTPPSCPVIELVPPGVPCLEAIEALAELAGLDRGAPTAGSREALPEPGDSPLDATGLAVAVANAIQAGTVFVDEANTGGVALQGPTGSSPEHTWLTVPGGSIGEGIPLAAGAALARPDHRVVALVADGSSLYTIQGLWTIAREELPVTVVILNNLRYAILQFEAARRHPMNDRVRTLTSLDPPRISYRKLAEGFGVRAEVAMTPLELLHHLKAAEASAMPMLIEAQLF